MLKVDTISKSYGQKKVLDKVRFEIEAGTIVGLVGENGAGKSTLINIIAGLLKPDAGSIHLNELHVKKQQKKYRNQIGYIPQDIAIWDHFTVAENMRFFEKLSNVKKTNAELKDICREMKLDKWHDPVKSLSGGQKRKLNMALSLIHDPTLLLLDEPTVGIDMRSKAEIINYIKQRAKKNNMIVLFTSHDMTEIEALCNRVICIGEDPFYYDLLRQADKEVVRF